MASDRDSSKAPLVGVLALQGDFADHQASLAAFGLRSSQVRRPDQLHGLDALVLPGGESTTMIKLLNSEGLWDPLGVALRSGVPVMATCAGLILLSEHVQNPTQETYGLLPLTVVRNGYGRQSHSGTFALRVETEELPEGLEGTFIRAPRVIATHGDCEVLARRDEDPALIRSGSLLAAGFHPELTMGHPVTRMFAEMVRAWAASPAALSGASALR